ncbi:MAG: tRNA 2-thiocytidine biosynthesis protein TtcA [Prevotella sp.]|nr:tRNA 2-thiocytidine biosynthesis protein TtcA [Prevotella sp.]
MESRRLEKRLNERFVKAMATYHLIEDDDHILVGLSGGKDSLLLLELLAKRSLIQHPRFKVEALHVRMENIHYETDTSYLQQFCDNLGIKLHVLTTSFETIENGKLKNEKSSIKRRQKQPCFLCSWNRRKQMFNLAQELGCNKIALGHHQDDLIYTALMNLTFQGRFDTMPARLKMRKMPLEIIRPLCMIPEADIKAYAELRDYQKQKKLCPYETNSYRTDIKQLYDRMEQLNPEARYSIWRAISSDNKLIEK